MTARVTTLRSQPQSDESPSFLYLALTPLRPFLVDDAVNEVCINRPGEVWTLGQRGWERHELPELSLTDCNELALLIAGHNRKAIDAERPVLSGSLLYGERVQVVIPPACEIGTVSLTIRKPSVLDKTLDELDSEGAFAQCRAVKAGIQDFERELLALSQAGLIKKFLDVAVRRHRNILIVGKTGSGKTTVAKSLIRSIPSCERLITIEDVQELFLAHHANRVHLFYGREDEGGLKSFAAPGSCVVPPHEARPHPSR